MAETMVRMAELAVSRRRGDTLSSIGLGSCIGLALVDRTHGIAGLAHVMLPQSSGTVTQPAKFADTAVPALVDALRPLGAPRTRLVAVMVGGAQMFGGGTLDVGSRNAASAQEALTRAGLQLAAADTGGGKGRTIRVDVATGAVTVKVAGGEAVPLWPPPSRSRPARDPLSDSRSMIQVVF